MPALMQLMMSAAKPVAGENHPIQAGGAPLLSRGVPLPEAQRLVMNPRLRFPHNLRSA